jgi:regulator of protease activity HflC (stomatin/prohibitin superfamily)
MVEMENMRVKLVALGVLVVAGIITLALTLESFDELAPEEMGLHYDSHKEQVKDDSGMAFMNGKYFLGLGQYFIKFPSTVTSMTLNNLLSRTSDGLAIHISVNFDYQLDPYSLLELYKKFGKCKEGEEECEGQETYKNIFSRIVENVLKLEATKHTASSFFTNRTTIGLRLEDRLRAEFIPQRIYAKVIAFQMLDIKLPKEFEAAVSENKLLLKEVETKEIERKRKVVEWTTILLQKEQRVSVDLKLAEATAAKTVVQAEADGRALVTQAENDAKARILEAEAKARTMKLDADSEAVTRVLQAQANAAKILKEAETEASLMVLEADTYAKKKLFQSQAQAVSLEEESTAYVSSYEDAQDRQSQSFVEVWKALGSNEDKFIEYQTVKALGGLSWKDWTIMNKDKTPFDLL